MDNKPNNKGGMHQPNDLVNIHEPPDSLVALRKELQEHPDICAAAMHGETFEECLGIIAAKLDIAVDGLYDAGEFCAMLVQQLKRRNSAIAIGATDRFGLIPAELHETEEGIALVEQSKAPLYIPEGAIVTEYSIRMTPDQTGLFLAELNKPEEDFDKFIEQQLPQSKEFEVQESVDQPGQTESEVGLEKELPEKLPE